jgi:hypothetical protein
LTGPHPFTFSLSLIANKKRRKRKRKSLLLLVDPQVQQLGGRKQEGKDSPVSLSLTGPATPRMNPL